MEKSGKERRALKEAWYFIVIPLIISIVCAWFDICANFVTGEYNNASLDFDSVTNVGTFITNESEPTKKVIIVKSITYGHGNWFCKIVRCAMGYLFPSLISIVIAMIWQQVSMEEKPYGIIPNKVFGSLIVTLLYSVLFISCLFMFNDITAILICLCSAGYAFYIGKYCLDKRILARNKNKMKQDELIEIYVEKIQ